MLQNLSFQKVQHVISTSTFQPMANGNILIFVLGKLRVCTFGMTHDAVLCSHNDVHCNVRPPNDADTCIVESASRTNVFMQPRVLLQSDEDQPMDFSETFVLANEAGNWCIMNDIFCLGLHDF